MSTETILLIDLTSFIVSAGLWLAVRGDNAEQSLNTFRDRSDFY